MTRPKNPQSNRKGVRPTKRTPKRTAPAARSAAELRERLQAATGESDIKVRQANWLRLMQEGVLVQLHIRRWRAQVQISFADLGLPEPKDAETKTVYDDLMTLGTKKLLPAADIAKLNSLDSGARKAVDSVAYNTYWGNFVVVGAYRELRAKLGRFELEYLALGDEIADKLDEKKREVATAYAIAAREGYRRLKRLNPKSLNLANGKQMPEDEFVTAFVARVMDAIPSAAHIRQSFEFEIELSYIPLPSLLAKDVAEKERIETERETERRRERIEQEGLKERERIEQEGLKERERALDRMNADIVNEARGKKNELINRFATDLQTQLLATVYDGLVNVLESVGKNDGTLVGKATQQVRSIIEQFRAMGEMVNDNAALEDQIARLSALMGTESSKRSPQEIANLMREIGTQARANMLVLGATPRSARHVGIPDQVQAMDMTRVVQRGLRTARQTQIQIESEA